MPFIDIIDLPLELKLPNIWTLDIGIAKYLENSNRFLNLDINGSAFIKLS